MGNISKPFGPRFEDLSVLLRQMTSFVKNKQVPHSRTLLNALTQLCWPKVRPGCPKGDVRQAVLCALLFGGYSPAASARPPAPVDCLQLADSTTAASCSTTSMVGTTAGQLTSSH
eukprot:GHVS01015862.1.p1 GENE.GHVS01015862.1~~GHVS01015862.1.p1  ORF type:complete len:115 (-),score=16.73 GHVS01015862.1:125-469(-)